MNTSILVQAEASAILLAIYIALNFPISRSVMESGCSQFYGDFLNFVELVKNVMCYREWLLFYGDF